MGGLGFWSTGNPGGSGVQIGNSYIPPEGPKALPLALDFTINTAYQLQVTDIFSKGPGKPGFSVLQGFYADNSQSAAQLTVTISGTGQTLIVPAGFEGYIPMLSPSGGTITFTSLGGIQLNVDLYNVPMPAMIWNASSAQFSFVSGGAASGALKTSDVILDAIIAAGGGGTSVPVTVEGASSTPATVLGVGAVNAAGLTPIFNTVADTYITGMLVEISADASILVADAYALQIKTNGGGGQYFGYGLTYIPAAPVAAPNGKFTVIDAQLTTPILEVAAQTISLIMPGTALLTGYVSYCLWGHL
jgi:hypothetical protein